MKQNLFIFTEQAENSESISMTSSISALFFFAIPPIFPLSRSLSVSPCLFFIYTSPLLSAVAQGAVTEVSLVIIGLIQ